MAIYLMNKKIAVIIVNYFSSSDLINTLDSLKKNHCYSQLEIQVVDNSCDKAEHVLLQQLAQQKEFILHIAD